MRGAVDPGGVSGDGGRLPVVAVGLAILALQAREWISRMRPTQLGNVREVVGALILGFAA